MIGGTAGGPKNLKAGVRESMVVSRLLSWLAGVLAGLAGSRQPASLTALFANGQQICILCHLDPDPKSDSQSHSGSDSPIGSTQIDLPQRLRPPLIMTHTVQYRHTHWST